MAREGLARLAATALLTASLSGIAAAQAAEQYVVQLVPLNAETPDQAINAVAAFAVDDGRLTITIAVNGLAPDVMHMQHYHGFLGGDDATCPTALADANGDGFIDLAETELVAGTAMVPLHADPASLELASATYPVADETGAIRYQKTVSLGRLRKTLQDRLGVPEFDLEKLVLIVHGVAPDAELPASARSRPGVPASMTLPVACGIIDRLE